VTKKPYSMIGWMVKSKLHMLGNPTGTIGFVFNQYDDFDTPEEGYGIQVIFPNGDYDGFSLSDQKDFLEFLHPVLTYAGYEFKNVIQVQRDFETGYWKFIEE
jgi:hypothetical protein